MSKRPFADGRSRGTGRSSIALCMIVKNEEKWLPSCLESVRGVVDEIIVVDTGSTDRTPDIARSFGAQVYFFPWCHDFADARNESLRHATADWILVLDADERLDAVNCDRLKAIARSDYDGVFVRIESPVQSLDSGLVDVSVFTRLFRNRPGVCFEGIIHEQVLPSIQRAGGKIADSDLTIFHAGYARDQAAMKEKHLRNLTLLEKQVAENPGFSLGVFHLAETYQLCEKFSQAMDAYGRALALGGLTSDIRAQVHQNLAYIHLHEHRFDESLAESRKALALQPNLVLPRALMAQVFMHRKNYTETVSTLVRAIELAETLSASGKSLLIRKIDPFFLLLFLGQAYENLGDMEPAGAAFQKALTLRPDRLEALLALGKNRLMRNDEAEACRLFSRALDHTGDNRERIVGALVEGLHERLSPHGLRAFVDGLTGQNGMANTPVRTFGARIRTLLTEIKAQFLAGMTYMRLQEFSNARACLLAAYRMNPDSTEILYNLGVVCLKLEDVEAARTFLVQARSLSADARTEKALELVNRLMSTRHHKEAV